MSKGIDIKNVSFAYSEEKNQLENINLSIPKKSFFGITGLNGSGKTTLTFLLNGLIPHQIKGNLKGDIYIDGTNTKDKPVSFFAKSVGMVFQNPDFMLFNLTVAEEIEFGLKNINLDNHTSRIKNALKLVDMENYEDRDPQSLSYGQKQKICLACILAQDSPYIVLDEPTAMLDYKSATKLYELLFKLNQKGKTIIIVEHDTDFLFKYADQIALIDKGKIILEGKPEDVFNHTQILKKIGIKIPNQSNL